MRRATPETFWAKVQRVSATDRCWPWGGAHFRSGYARVKYQGRDTVAHRVAWELDRGLAVPKGLQLDHLCRNRACVRPDHLEPVAPRVNVLRGKTITAANAAKTVCVRGHALSGYNLFVRRDGRRRCRECERACQKKLRGTSEYRAKHAAYERKRRTAHV